MGLQEVRPRHRTVMGFLSRPKSNVQTGRPASTQSSRLRPLGSYESKADFLRDWAADIFRAAGSDPAEHADGILELAGIAGFSRIWLTLMNMANNDNNAELASELQRLRDGMAATQSTRPMLEHVDELYERSVISRSAASGRAVPEVRREIDQMFDESFTDGRAEYIAGVHKGDF